MCLHAPAAGQLQAAWVKPCAFNVTSASSFCHCPCSEPISSSVTSPASTALLARLSKPGLPQVLRAASSKCWYGASHAGKADVIWFDVDMGTSVATVVAAATVSASAATSLGVSQTAVSTASAMCCCKCNTAAKMCLHAPAAGQLQAACIKPCAFKVTMASSFCHCPCSAPISSCVTSFASKAFLARLSKPGLAQVLKASSSKWA